MIRLEGISKRFGVNRVLEDISLFVEAKQRIALLGPNATGKSTLLRILAGLISPDCGSVTYGKDNLTASQARARIGYCSHETLCYQELTPYENLLFYARLYGISKPRQVIGQLFEDFSLSWFAKEPVKYLSQGTKRRLALARSLINDPEYLLLDEPFANLDAMSLQLVSQYILNAKPQRTIIFTTHQPRLGYAFANRVLVLNNGKIIQDETTEDDNDEEFEKRYIELTGGGY